MDDYNFFRPTAKDFAEIRKRNEEELALREFYRNLTESDKRFLRSFGISWEAK